jgi:hypothetical protein
MALDCLNTSAKRQTLPQLQYYVDLIAAVAGKLVHWLVTRLFGLKEAGWLTDSVWLTDILTSGFWLPAAI